MKVSMKWFAVLFVAGTAMAGSAFAGPAMGPYGIWNSGGAFGSFGPYQRPACAPVAERVIINESPRQLRFGQYLSRTELLAPVAEQVTIEKRNLGRKHLVETRKTFTQTRIVELRPKRTLWKEPVIAERIVEEPALFLEKKTLSSDACGF